VKLTPFAIGRRWFADRTDHPHRARFWWVILGPGENYSGKISPEWKRCRIEVHPDDRKKLGASAHGEEGNWQTKHLKKYARLEPVTD
jgi:hypothetical protein